MPRDKPMVPGPKQRKKKGPRKSNAQTEEAKHGGTIGPIYKPHPESVNREIPLDLGDWKKPEKFEALIEKIIVSDESPVDMRDLAAQVLQQFQGTKGIARELKDQYDKTLDKPREHANLMSVIFRIIDRGKQDSIANKEDVDDIDIEMTILDILKRNGLLNAKPDEATQQELKQLREDKEWHEQYLKYVEDLHALQWVDHFCI